MSLIRKPQLDNNHISFVQKYNSVSCLLTHNPVLLFFTSWCVVVVVVFDGGGGVCVLGGLLP